ncbi:MAG: carbon-nitrogen hydrolase family protein [Candidatus Rifleibacteriota bacterium]
MMKRPPIKIAMAQTYIQSDIIENCHAIEKAIKTAAEKGARLLHLPEGALSGYVKSQITGWSDFDWQGFESSISRICEAAASKRIWVVVGGVKSLPFPYRPFNSLFLINDRGELAGRYDKRLISNTELKSWFTPGKNPLVFEVDGYRFGLASCIEINFPEIFMDYGNQNVDCILCSSYSENQLFKTLAQAHASFNCCWFSLVVPANVSHSMPSLACGPDGRVIKTAKKNTRGLTVFEIVPDEPSFAIALQRARLWRQKVRTAGFYEPYQPNHES